MTPTTPYQRRQLPRPTDGAHPALLGLAILAVPAASLLRTFNDHTPRLPFLPGPFASLLFWAALGLLALHLVERRRDRDLMPDIERGTGLTLAMVVPFLVVLFVEKWVTVELLDRAFAWIDVTFADDRAADAAYRLWTGLALAGVALALYRVPRQVARKFERRTDASRVIPALGIFAAATLAAGLLFVAIPIMAGVVNVAPPAAPGPGFTLMVAAQVVRGAAEELYFRGLLQTVLLRLLWQTGIPQGRIASLIAISTVSLGFTIEHWDPSVPFAAARSELIWVFAISSILGLMLETSRNLYLTMLAHTQLNLIVAGLLPQPLSLEGAPLLQPVVPATVFLMLLFVGIVIAHRRRGFR